MFKIFRQNLTFLYPNFTQMEAGSDTTASTLLSFLLAMIKYPTEFTKAQREVDAVCGPLRSPTSDDIQRLPFIKACMDEVSQNILRSSLLFFTFILNSLQTLRWRPVAPAGVPHALTRDDTYEGYFFPKGTIVVANTWAIHNDETQYERPSDFMPDRFLNNEYGTRDPVDTTKDDHRRTSYAFGAGRRACPGQRVAKNSLVRVFLHFSGHHTLLLTMGTNKILNMAKIAWTFDLAPGAGVVDDDIITAYHDGFLIAPKKFPIMITPRSERHQRVVANEYDSIKSFWEKYED